MTLEKAMSGDSYDHDRRQFRQKKNLDLEQRRREDQGLYRSSMDTITIPDVEISTNDVLKVKSLPPFSLSLSYLIEDIGNPT